MIAEAGGRAYLFPQRQVQQPVQSRQAAAPQQQEGTPWDIPMGDELANVENLTNNYYNAYGTLKDFTTTMWKDYGVDVTKPDFSQPGGGQLHQAFQAMDANLRMTANDLAEQKKRTDEMAKLEAQGKVTRAAGYDPYKQLYRESPVSPYVSTQLEDAALKAIERAGQTYYDDTSAQAARTEIDKVIKMYDEKMNADSYNREYYKMQRDAIMQAAARPPSVAFKEPSPTRGLYQGIVDNSKKVVKDNTGYGWTPNRLKYRYINGKVVPSVTPEQETSHGAEDIEILDPSGKKTKTRVQKTVDFYYMDPASGHIYARYTGPLADPKYDERTDNKLASEMINEFHENNPKYGTPMQAAAALTSYTKGETGGLDVQSFLTPEEIQQGNIFKQQSQATANQIENRVKQEKERFKSEIKKAQAQSGWGYGTFTIPIKNQDVVFSGKALGRKGIDLGTNQTEAVNIFKELMGRDRVQNEIKIQDMTPDELINLLDYFGYFDEFVDKATPALPTAAPSPAGSTPAVKKKEIKASEIKAKADLAGQTEENYRAILNKNGVTILENQ